MSFLDLRLNNISLDLPGGGLNISGEINNSIISDQEEGVFSFPFDLPATPTNNKILGYPQSLLNKNNLYKKYTGLTIFIAGSLWKTGILILRGYKDGKFTCNFQADISFFAFQTQSKKLTEYSLGGIREVTKAPYLKMTIDFATPPDHTASIYVPDSPNGVVGEILSYTVSNTVDEATTIIALRDMFLSTPDLADYGILDVVADGSDIYFYSNTQTKPFAFYLGNGVDPVTENFILGPNADYDLDPDNTGFISTHINDLKNESYPATDYVFFPVKNDAFYSDNANYSGIINDFNSITGKFRINDGTNPLTYSITPFPYMLSILKYIIQESNLFMYGSFTEDAEIQKLVIYNNFALDDVVYSYNYGTSYNRWMGKINLQNHVPDILASDFVKAVKSYFRLGLFFDNKGEKIEITTLNKIITSPDYDDWTGFAQTSIQIDTNNYDGYTFSISKDDDDAQYKKMVFDFNKSKIKTSVNKVSDLPTTGNSSDDVRLVKTLNKYYKATQSGFASDGTAIFTWTEYAENLQSYTVDNGTQKIEIGAGTSVTYKDNTIIPYVSQAGTSNFFNQGKNNFSLRFLFYRGMDLDGTLKSYPLGTPYNYNYNGAKIGNYSLALDQDAGIYNQFQKEWATFLANANPVTLILNFNLNTFLSLDLQKKKRINDVTYIVSKVTFNISDQGLKAATVVLLRV
jgi:hypothetical protein